MMNASERRGRLAAARLYLVCDGRRDDLDEFLDAVLSAGVDIVQLRDKDLDARPLLARAERFRAVCDRHGTLFIVNDRVDIALAAGADGVHVGQDDLDPSLVHTIAGDALIVGRSTHTVAQMHAASTEPVDYFCTGPVFATPTKPGRAATGLSLIEATAGTKPSKPWFAIGGITAGNAGEVTAAGADRIVVVRAITQAPDPAAAAAALAAMVSPVASASVDGGAQ